jgi:hypothetical protein
MHIKIKTIHGEKEVEAFPTAHPQIVVHRTSFGSDKNEALGFWGVTHLPSGFSFARLLPNREIAELSVPFFMNAGLDLEADREGIEKSASLSFKAKMKSIREASGEVDEAIMDLLEALEIPHYAE